MDMVYRASCIGERSCQAMKSNRGTLPGLKSKTSKQPSTTSLCEQQHHHKGKMDSLNISPETAQGLQNLSQKDRQELNQFVLQESTATLTSSFLLSIY